MAKSLTKNSFFYFIYNVLNMAFPFLTSMYVARILPPATIGEVAYAQNIVQYFAVLAFLGIPTYGLREISKARNQYDELSNLFSELFVINFISTVIFSVLYYGMIFVLPGFQTNLLLYCVVGLTVILNMLNISWLYDGLEEFRYVSIRNGIFKFLMFGLLLILVQTPDDMIPYASITVLGVAGNNVVNMVLSRNFVTFRLKDLNLARHMKSIFMLVAVNIAIEIYSLVGTSLLGIFSTKESVAFYSYADKTNKILLQITNSITMVLVPRIALYYGEGRLSEFNGLLTKAVKILVLFGLPMIIGIQFTADFMYSQVFGAAYIRSAFVEKILCFVLLIAPVGYLLGSRVLLVSGHDNKMMICVSIGAIVNVVSNCFLIPLYNEIGAALACVFSEMVVAIIFINYGKKVFNLFPLKRNFMNVTLASFAMVIYLIIVSKRFETGWLRLLIQVFGSGFIYLLVLAVLKDSLFCEYKERFMERF